MFGQDTPILPAPDYKNFESVQNLFGHTGNKITMATAAPIIMGLFRAIDKKSIFNFSKPGGGSYCDSPLIFIDSSYTVPQFWQEYFKKLFDVDITLQEAQVISVIVTVGVMNHEVRHTIHTKSTNLLKLAEKFVRSGRIQKHEVRELKDIINICEDHFIDSYNRNDYNTLLISGLLDEMRSILNPFDLPAYESIVNGEISYSALKKLYVSHLNPYAPSELRDILDSGNYGLDLFDEIQYEPDFNRRVELSVQFYEVLKQYMTEEEQEQQKAQGEMEEMANELQQMAQDIADKINEEIKSGSDLGKEIQKSIQEAIESAKQEAKKTLEKPKERKIELPPVVSLINEAVYDDYEFIYNMPTGSGYTNFEVKPEYNRLSELFRLFKSFNLKGERPKNDGRLNPVRGFINVLSGGRERFKNNYSYDGKVSKPIKEPGQLILLGDVSGSTDSHYGNSKPLHQVEVEAICGISEALHNSNVQYMSLLHTTSDKDCSIYVLGGYQMPINKFNAARPSDKPVDMKVRHNAIQAGNIHTAGNCDGFALLLGSKFFVENGKSKTIVMLSDGYPTSSPDSKYSPEEYLVKTIEQLRKSGVNVFSISMVADVVKNNDKYYGKKYNIDASKSLEAAMQEFYNNFMYGVE